MAKIGLVAGAGDMPVEFASSAKRSGDKVIVFAVEGISDKRLEEIAEKIYWLRLTQYRKLFVLLVTNGIRRLVLLGKFEKKIIYEKGRPRAQHSRQLTRLKDGKDYSILGEITRRLALIGVKVTDGLDHLGHLLVPRGVLTSTVPSETAEKDISYGYSVAKTLADMDIGQTVVVKNKTVVAVEAMEGTDKVIERAAAIAGEGCVMVKVSRPGQDMRWDVPVVGPDTVKKLTEGKFSALAIQSGKMFIINRQETVKIADASALAIKGLV